MDIREAKYILEIEKSKQLTKAANNLYITQPALSKTLKKLEGEFEGSLFYREGADLYPTELGAIVVKGANIIVKEFQKMNDEIQKLQTLRENTIDVGLPLGGAFMVAPMLIKFNEMYPDIKVNASLHGGNDLNKLLNTAEIDLAFLMYDDICTTSTLEGKLFLSSELAVGIPWDHQWSKKERIKDEQFRGTSFVTLDMSSQTITSFLGRLRTSGVEAQMQLQSSDVSWLIEYSKVMKVPCVLPKKTLQHHAKDSLDIKGLEPKSEWKLAIAHLHGRPLSNAAKKFLKCAIEYAKENNLK